MIKLTKLGTSTRTSATYTAMSPAGDQITITWDNARKGWNVAPTDIKSAESVFARTLAEVKTAIAGMVRYVPLDEAPAEVVSETKAQRKNRLAREKRARLAKEIGDRLTAQIQA